MTLRDVAFNIVNTAMENMAQLLRCVKNSKTNVRKSALQVPGDELHQTASCFESHHKHVHSDGVGSFLPEMHP